MLNYQTTENTVSLTFSKAFLSSPEIVRLIETLRIKELLSKSQLNTDEVIKLDDELKENWWQANKQRFLEKLDD